MTDSIAQCLCSNAIKLVTDNRIEGLRCTFHLNLKCWSCCRSATAQQLLPEIADRLTELDRSCTASAKLVYGVSALRNGVRCLLNGIFYSLLCLIRTCRQ